MDRVAVVGATGAGKTTLARRLADALDATHVELDGLRHRAGWTMEPDDVFLDRVDAALPADGRWVADGNYWRVSRDLVWGRAQAVVFVDVPRWRAMSQLVPRTLRRVITRETLWNGNREDWRNLLSSDPHRNLLVWAWTTHARVGDGWRTATDDPRWRDVDLVHVRTRREADDLVTRVRQGAARGDEEGPEGRRPRTADS